MTPKHNNDDFRTGLHLFNRAQFFDAHEALENAWRSVPVNQPLRRHLQGMVQLAVAFHHVSKGNCVGARSVLERAMRNLNGAEISFPDLDLVRLRADLAPWSRYLDHWGKALNAPAPASDHPQNVPTTMAPKRPQIVPRS